MIGLIKKSIPKDVPKEDSEPINKIKCIDLNYLLNRTKSDPALMMEMISLYLEQTPTLVNTMKKSFHENDWETLKSAVHKMIPSFSIMGISTDYEIMAKTIQEYANTMQQNDTIHDLVIQLDKVCSQACIELLVEFNLIKNSK